MSDAADPVEVEATLPLRGKGIRLRTQPRFVCPPGAAGSVRTEGDEPVLRALIRDLSCSGLGLLVRRPLAPQTPVLLRLRDPQHGHEHKLQACVVHVTPQAPGEWLLGCAFLQELTRSELQALLGPPARERKTAREGRNHELN